VGTLVTVTLDPPTDEICEATAEFACPTLLPLSEFDTEVAAESSTVIVYATLTLPEDRRRATSKRRAASMVIATCDAATPAIPAIAVDIAVVIVAFAANAAALTTIIAKLPEMNLEACVLQVLLDAVHNWFNVHESVPHAQG